MCSDALHSSDILLHIPYLNATSIAHDQYTNIIFTQPKEYEFLGSYKDVQKTPILSSPEVAFIGRSNVGKSSLLNCLTGANKKIAIVGKTPGRTQCINMFKCADKEGDIAVLVDLPGYGFAKLSRDAQEQISGFLEGYLTDRGALRLVVMLVDSRRDVRQYGLCLEQ
jgi:GTP-binding protein